MSLLLPALFLFGALMPPLAEAQTAEREIRTLLEQRDRQLKQAIKPLIDNPKGATSAQKSRVADLINGLVDFHEMGRQALGPHWEGLSSTQRTAFIDVFSEIVRSQSLADFEVYNAAVTYGEIRVSGNSATVATRTTYKGKSTKVDYQLARKDGSWYATNITIDDVGTVEGYARSFQSVIRKRGFDALMASLRKKRDQIAGA
jgi:phospholipid transport system substrate-binding protein